MAGILFGTDGIRGQFGQYPVVPGFFSRLARATEEFFAQYLGKDRLKVAIGRDTRESGEILVQALIAGFSDRVTALQCGVLPTPAVAYITRKLGCDCGFSVTASHNPYHDNGVKIFNGEGEKLPIDLELGIENLVQILAMDVGAAAAEVINHVSAAEEEFCASFDNVGFTFGGRVVLDVANGAGTATSPPILRKICRDLVVIGDKPDGKNINVECGSESIATLCQSVKDHRAAVGIAHDGDADRLVMVDETGVPVNGDQVLGVIAKYLFNENRLSNNLLVVTEQSNSGLDSSLSKLGIGVVRCGVGDRNVYYSMLKHGASLGGEESGHLILREFSNTGDAISAAVLMLKIMAETGAPLSLLKDDISLLPKKLHNIKVSQKIPLSEIDGFDKLLNFLKTSEPNYGRVFVRYSGTENKLRVLVEARTEATVDKILTCVCEFLERRLTYTSP
ncbi:MAG: hypothetical protein LBS87_02465 [Puniceicoccales bacterium]|nr:hypothetical protein [Puniceicoccales bacterium]